jgi:ribosomal subunit interface protein
MTIQVTGKNIEVGSALQTYLVDKTRSVLEKYIGPEISGHLRVSKERSRFQTNCSIRLRTGLLLEAHGEGADAYASADMALERLDKRVRRYKRRLKDHHSESRNATFSQSVASDYVVQIVEEEPEPTEKQDEPLIIAETERVITELPVNEAVMQLDLTDEPFLVFRNAASGSTNIVYRRNDGNVGWIDPGKL